MPQLSDLLADNYGSWECFPVEYDRIFPFNTVLCPYLCDKSTLKLICGVYLQVKCREGEELV